MPFSPQCINFAFMKRRGGPRTRPGHRLGKPRRVAVNPLFTTRCRVVADHSFLFSDIVPACRVAGPRPQMTTIPDRPDAARSVVADVCPNSLSAALRPGGRPGRAREIRANRPARVSVVRQAQARQAVVQFVVRRRHRPETSLRVSASSDRQAGMHAAVNAVKTYQREIAPAQHEHCQ